jgi:hypothetical protein
MPSLVSSQRRGSWRGRERSTRVVTSRNLEKLNAIHVFEEEQVVFHSQDFSFPISLDPNDFFIPDFPGNQSGIPGNQIY